MAKLLFQGHGSVRITSDNGCVCYVDPYAGSGYDLPCDLILVSHQHGDHNKTDLCAKKQDCQIISQEQALIDGQYKSFVVKDFAVQAVEAYNCNHDKQQCVGFLITVDGKTVYVSGDTSTTDQMRTFKALNLDYALLCCDGVYNMGLEEAAACSQIIGAKHTVPVHMKVGKLFDDDCAQKAQFLNKLILKPNQEWHL